MEFNKRLISLREQRGFTQNSLAEWAGVSQTHLRRVERGESDITVGHLQLLCDAMNITLRDFFAEDSQGAEYYQSSELYAAISKLTPKQQKLLLAFLESL